TTAGGIRFGVWVNVSLKGFRMKTVDFAAAGMSTDVPRPLSGASVAVRNIFLPYHFVRNSTDEKIVLGGTFFLEILALPPGVKKIKARGRV
ncbi:unnamed protein product, partial [Hapterophycus canaliculatus]